MSEINEAAPQAMALPPPAPEGARPDPIRKWVAGVVAVLLGLLALQITSDRTAPVTSLATVEGLVLPLSLRVAGEIESVGVVDNQVVEAGARLVSIDPTPFRLAVETAEAQLAQAGQAIGSSTEQVATAQARLAQARASLSNARAQAERVLELVKRGVFPKAKGDTAEQDLSRAESEVTAAEAGVRGAEAALGPAGQANPQLRAASAAVERARFDLARTALVAPTLGYVTNMRLGAGQFIQAGQPLLTMIDLTGCWIVANFRENQMGAIRHGDRVEIALEVSPGRILAGRVVSISGGVSTPTQTAPPGGLMTLPTNFLQTPQRFAVRIEFDPPNLIPRGVRVGAQATVIVHTGRVGFLDPLWSGLIRVISWLSYVY